MARITLLNSIINIEWPVNNSILIDFRNKIISDWIKIFNKDPLNDVDSYTLYITFSSAINRALILFELSIIRKKNYDMYLSLYNLHNQFKEILSPDRNVILENYIKSLNSSWFKKLIKVQITQFKKIINKIDLNTKICFRNTQLINKHIDYTEDKPFIIPAEYFLFFNLNKYNKENHNDKKIKLMIDAVISRSLEFGSNLTNDEISNLKIYISSYQSTHKNFIYSLQKKYKNPPSELWLFSPQPMQSFIASWVRTFGGNVISHEHGSGEGWSKNALDSLFDFEYSDEFFCYTNSNKKNYKKIQIKNNILIGSRCKIKTLKNPQFSSLNKSKINKKIKKICIVGGSYRYDSILYSIQPHGLILMKIHLNLIEILEKNNFEVFVRPHPENLLPNIFHKKNIDSSGSIDNVFLNYDSVFFDTIQTTAFYTLLRKNISINILDLGTNELNSLSREMLAKRCSIINVKKNNSGNFELNENDIINSIDKSILLSDNEFMNEHMNY